MCDVARYIVLLAKSRLWNYLARRICVYRWRSLCSSSWCWEQRSGTTASPSRFSRTTSRRRTDTFSWAEENRTRDLSRRGDPLRRTHSPDESLTSRTRIRERQDTTRDTFEPTTTTAAPFRYPWALARAQFILSLVSLCLLDRSYCVAIRGIEFARGRRSKLFIKLCLFRSDDKAIERHDCLRII